MKANFVREVYLRSCACTKYANFKCLMLNECERCEGKKVGGMQLFVS